MRAITGMRGYIWPICPIWAAGFIWLILATAPATSARADGAATSTNALPASSDPLMDLFIKKGFVTQQEAEQVEAEARAMQTNQAAMPAALPASKWVLNHAVKHIELFGDVRLRYEDRTAEDPSENSIDLRRFRYSVRVGLRGDVQDDFYYGIRLDTGANPRSTFVTAGTSASGGAYQGPFGKSNAGLNIGQVYLGWHPEDWVDVTVGKMPNPLYTSSLVWSGNINPEGFAERFKYPVGQADFFANFGQFLYADFNPNTASSGLGVGLPTVGSSAVGSGQKTSNIFMLAWQGGFNYRLTTNVSFKVAGTLYNYIGLEPNTANGANNGLSALTPYYGDPYIGEGAYYYYASGYSGTARGYSGYNPGQQFGNVPADASYGFPFNQVGLDHLLVLEIPFELRFPISRFDAGLFGDFAYNLEGADRAKAAAAAYSSVLNFELGQNPTTALSNSIPAEIHDVKAWQFGFEIGSRGSLGLVNGEPSHRHAWEIKTYWQHIEQYALDPNILDTDFFEGRENMEGIYMAASFALTEDLIATVRYGHASRINPALGTGGSNQDIPQINPINSYDLYQFDLTLKF